MFRDLRETGLGSNWNLEMLIFVERGKTKNPEKFFEQGENQQQTQPTYDSRQDLMNPGQIVGRRVLSSLRQILSGITSRIWPGRYNKRDNNK